MWRWLRIRVKRTMPRGLFGRSLLIIVTPIVLLQAIVTWVFLERQFQDVAKRLAGDVAGEVFLLVEAYEAFPENADALAALARSTILIEVSVIRGAVLPRSQQRPFYDIVGRSVVTALQETIRRPLVPTETMCWPGLA